MIMAAEGFTYERADAFGLPRPDGWERLEADGDMLAVAHPPVPEGVFRPNMVLRWGPHFDGSAARYATAGLAGVLKHFDDVRIISNEVWPLAAGGTEFPGRRQRFIHQVDRHPVCVDRWLWIVGPYAVEATASYTVEQHIGMKLLFEQMIRDLRIDQAALDQAALDHTAEPPSAGRPEIDTIAPEEPRTDAFASGQAGTALEDLSALPAAQTYRETGRVLAISSLELVDTLNGRDRLGPFERRGAAAAELHKAGLLARDGRLTAEGRGLQLAPGDIDASFVLNARSEAGTSMIQAWIGGGRGKIAAGPSLFAEVPPAASGFGPEDLAVQVIPANVVPKRLADWVGLTPAWTAAHEPILLTPDHFEARAKSARTIAPKGLSPAAQRMWDQPWTDWDVLEERTGAWFGWVNAGPAGQYRISPADGNGVRLDPMPSAVVWDVLVRFIHASVERIPLQLPEVPGFNGPAA